MRWMIAGLFVLVIAGANGTAAAEDLMALRQALTLHASFDQGMDADWARADSACLVREGNGLVPAVANDQVRLAAGAGRYGNALHFTEKSAYRPLYQATETLAYNTQSWQATVSIWMRLNPDLDLESGYCDPVQIIGDDTKKGFIFLEWSKNETPRFFRFAIRPLVHLWNPDNLAWEDITADKRPMVQIQQAPFSRENWTHVAFTLESINNPQQGGRGTLYLNGQAQGTIENWDLTFGWDPQRVQLVLGAAYVGYLDDLAVFDRALCEAEVRQLYELPGGARDLWQSQK